MCPLGTRQFIVKVCVVLLTYFPFVNINQMIIPLPVPGSQMLRVPGVTLIPDNQVVLYPVLFSLLSSNPLTYSHSVQAPGSNSIAVLIIWQNWFYSSIFSEHLACTHLCTPVCSLGLLCIWAYSSDTDTFLPSNMEIMSRLPDGLSKTWYNIKGATLFTRQRHMLVWGHYNIEIIYRGHFLFFFTADIYLWHTNNNLGLRC